jgi:hypothetical protein
MGSRPGPTQLGHTSRSIQEPRHKVSVLAALPGTSARDSAGIANSAALAALGAGVGLLGVLLAALRWRRQGW